MERNLEEENQKYEELLQLYDISPTDPDLKDLTVHKGEIYHLSSKKIDKLVGERVTDIYAHITLKSIDQIKELIGVPDVITKKIPPKRPMTVVQSLKTIKDLKSNQIFQLKKIANDYVFGYSKPYSKNKSVLQTAYIDIGILGKPEIFIAKLRDITVESGGVLDINKNVPVVVARNIKIFKGGKILSHGNLKLNCVVLEGENS